MSSPLPEGDAAELCALVQRYARAVDERDIEALTALFHPDASIEGTRGSQSLDQWLDAMRAPRTFPSSMHLLGSPLVDLAAATMDTYAVVFQLGDRDAGQSDLTMGVRYLDEVERFEGRWVIRNRLARILWTR